MNDPRKTAARRWHILGAGAMGCLWAGRLALAGVDTNLIVSDHRRTEAYHGLQIETSGQIEAAKPQITSASGLDESVQLLLVCTKAWAVNGALAAISDHIDEHSCIIMLQNGMGFQEAVVRQFPDSAVFCALCTEGVWQKNSFHVVHAGIGNTLIGAWLEKHREQETQIVTSMSASTLEVKRCDDLQLALWQKLAVNCAINPLTAVYGLNNGEILTDPRASKQLAEVVKELELLLFATGRNQLAAEISGQVKRIALATRHNRSSMRQDIEAGRRTEIEYLTGFLCRQAAKAELTLPVNRELYLRVLELESGR